MSKQIYPSWLPPYAIDSLKTFDAEAGTVAHSTSTVAKHGQLRLELLADGPGYRYAKAPLSLGRLLRIDPADDSTQIGYVRSTGGGLAQGDQQFVEIQVRDGAHLLLTTQAATRVHSMDSGFAMQDTQLTVAANGILEYLPDPIIASGHSRYLQRTTINCGIGATVIAGDAFVAGRIAMGEIHKADAMFIRSELNLTSGQESTEDRQPIFIETALYDSANRFTSPLNHGEYTAWANLWLVCPNETTVQNVLKEWRNYPTLDGLVVGASGFPHGMGCWVRFIGDSLETVLAARHDYWDRARRITLNREAVDLRKM